MHCRIHKENFLSENGCPQCIKAWMFRADSKISEIHKGVEAMAVGYDNLKQQVSDLEQDVDNQVQMRLDSAAESNHRIAILVLEKESLERKVEDLDIMLAQDEKKLSRARVKLDTTQWEHLETIDREVVLRVALEFYADKERYPLGQGKIITVVEDGGEKARKALKFHPSDTPEVQFKPQHSDLELSGFVPGGMIETHKISCNIWRKWRGEPRECTCRNCRDCGQYPCDCARDC